MTEITACMIVKNEDRFVWYAVSSILPYVSGFIIFDTGSFDKTVEIIKTIRSPKIIFQQKNKISPSLLTSYRQEQADMVRQGWLWLVDGDEVYPEITAKKVQSAVNNNPQLNGIIIRRYDLLGDIYHYQKESVGSYNQFGKVGHYVLRLLNKNSFPELEVLGDYPNEYFAQNGISIKERKVDQFAFVEDRIFHAMYLKRSTKGSILKDVINRQKYKTELGMLIDRNLIPEIFHSPKPKIVPSVVNHRTAIYLLAALFLTPLKKLKRWLFPKNF